MQHLIFTFLSISYIMNLIECGKGKYFYRHNKLLLTLPFLLLNIFLFSCNIRSQEQKLNTVTSDSMLFQKQKQAYNDSLAKAAASSNKMKIYLTFDDGPNNGTLNVLNVINADSIPASFFIVGYHVQKGKKQKAVLKTLQESKNVALCNHSFSHAYNHYTKFYSDPSSVVKDIESNNDLIKFNNRIVRMPGRNAWRIDTINHTDIVESGPAFDSVYAAGFDIMGWDIEWMFDHKTLRPDSSIDLLLRRMYNLLESGKTRTQGHLVLLAHDQSFHSEEAVLLLRQFISLLKNNTDYELVLATNYPGLRKH